MGKIAILAAKRLMIRYLAMVFIYLEGNWNSYIYLLILQSYMDRNIPYMLLRIPLFNSVRISVDQYSPDYEDNKYG